MRQERSPALNGGATKVPSAASADVGGVPERILGTALCEKAFRVLSLSESYRVSMSPKVRRVLVALPLISASC